MAPAASPSLLRDWRSLRRRCHRSLLARLRGASQSPVAAASDPTATPGGGGGQEERAQPWLSAAYGALVAAKRRHELAQASAIAAPRVSRSLLSDPIGSGAGVQWRAPRTLGTPIISKPSMSTGDTAPVPVLSVGNFTFGATGKTPCVLLLTELALRHARRDRRRHRCGRVPMLLTRGYGDDEWRQFAAKFPTCELAVGADRLRVGQQRVRELGGRDALSCVVLDDGLQQWRIRKDLEVVMVDALHPFGNGLLIPHGSLRETPRDALARADIIVIHHADLLGSPEALEELKTRLLALASPGPASAAPPTAMIGASAESKGVMAEANHAAAAAPPVLATSRMRVKRVVHAFDMGATASWVPGVEDTDTSTDDYNGEEARYGEFGGKVALVVCGVGNPESVQLVVEAMGCWHEVHMEAFPDHHAFSGGDLDDMKQRVADLARTTQRDVVVLTTEKDFYRTKTLLLEYLATSGSSCDVRVLQCELELVENAQRVRDLVRVVLDRDVQDQDLVNGGCGGAAQF